MADPKIKSSPVKFRSLDPVTDQPNLYLPLFADGGKQSSGLVAYRTTWQNNNGDLR